MKTRTIDDNKDWKFGRGLQDYKTGADALRQNIASRIRSWKGDCFFSTEEGVDWNNYLGIGTKAFLDLDLQRVILQSTGVIRLREYESDLDRETRNVSIQFTVDTIYGQLSVEEVVANV